MPAMSGFFPKNDPVHPGWGWQIYADPASATGYTRKLWNPRDDSNGGRPTEYFDKNYDFAADQRDEEATSSRTAQKAAEKAQAKAEKDAAIAREEAARKAAGQNVVNTADRNYGEGVRQFNVSSQQTATAENNRVQQVRNALKEQQRQFDLNYKISQQEAQRADQRLGLDTLTAGAGMRGSLNFLEGDAFANGVSGAGLSPFVQALGRGTPVAYGGGTATQGNPTPLTLGTLANAMTQGQAGSNGAAKTDAYGRPLLSAQNQQFVDAASKVYQQGLANQPLGFLENMDDDQRKAFADAGGWLGRNTNQETTKYVRSRPTQGQYY